MQIVKSWFDSNGSRSNPGGFRERRLAEYATEEWRRQQEQNFNDLRLMPRIYSGFLQPLQTPGITYRRIQEEANTFPISLHESNTLRNQALQLEIGATRITVQEVRNLQAILHYKAQLCIGLSTRDNYWRDIRNEVRYQAHKSRKILIELEELAQELGRFKV